ncbi:type II secretion system protein [bacterium]|nr:type II secretion system protein [bacterium]
MLKYEIKKGKNLKEDIMIKNSHCEDEKITCHPELVSGSHDKVDSQHREKIPKQVRNDMNNPTTTDAAMTPHPTLSHKGRGKVKVAFTLAEVLITLGIIGVVAALTLPAVVQHYKKVETIGRLKKFYSTMSQAIVRSELDNGPIDDWGLQGPSGNLDLEQFFMTYLAPYIKFTESGYCHTSNDYCVYMPDGSSFYFYKGSCMDFFYDTNGFKKKPNKHGRDWFRFLACSVDSGYCDKRRFCGWGYFTQSRAQNLEHCKNGDRGAGCTALIEMDGWEIKDDYPFKL